MAFNDSVMAASRYHSESEASDTAVFESALTDLFLGPDEGEPSPKVGDVGNWEGGIS
jgi:hypothetical protein